MQGTTLPFAMIAPDGYRLSMLLTIAVLARLVGHDTTEAIADWATRRAEELNALFRRAHTTIPRGSPRGTHLLAAYVPEQGVVLAQVDADQKRNERSAVSKLLTDQSLHGTVITLDAL